MKERIAICLGYRTPMGKMGGNLSKISADVLGSFITREVFSKYQDYSSELDEVIVGNVSQPADSANIARVIALRAGIDQKIPAYTVHRNCASGMEAVTSGVCKILSGKSEVILAAGVESMSNLPFLFSNQAKDFFESLAYSRTISQKLRNLLKFKFNFIAPVIALKCGLTDPICNMIMGDTAELLAKEFNITREEQDKFACLSHNRAEKATKKGIFAEEIIPYPVKNKMIETDQGIRNGQNNMALAKLKPFFDRKNGTVTAGNSSQITDAAGALIMMREEKAKSLGLKPLGYVKDFCYMGLEGERMGLGPAYTIANLLLKHKKSIKDIDLFEINEAFASQTIACTKALNSAEFCKNKLGLKAKLGLIPSSKLNVNGGAISLGHPVGMSGIRLIITLLRELKRQNKQTGIASLCVGGGQGGACLLEVN